MSESKQSHKQSLECLRLVSDCLQLAEDVHDPDLKSHFLRMAQIWSDRAGSAAGAVTIKTQTT